MLCDHQYLQVLKTLLWVVLERVVKQPTCRLIWKTFGDVSDTLTVKKFNFQVRKNTDYYRAIVCLHTCICESHVVRVMQCSTEAQTYDLAQREQIPGQDIRDLMGTRSGDKEP